ncbi:MAG: D-alanine--D-alanine ligase [Pseudomonadota bacterium]|nr:D-alanine--D-alanine ligase [Pseudomonadota bacterium]
MMQAMSPELLKEKTVTVVFGGWAAECEVSKRSAAAVIAALESKGYRVQPMDLNDLALDKLSELDVVFNIVHGRGGEDGHLQALLDQANVPYTGSGVAASALAMDKILTKRVWRGMGLPTANYVTVSAKQKELPAWPYGYPLIVKAAHEGSSIGMYRVEEEAQLAQAIRQACEYDTDVLLEQWLSGREFTVAVLDGQPLPPIELKYSQSFYDYSAKYERNDTQYLCPAPISTQQTEDLQSLAVKAFEGLKCSGWGRIDVMTDDNGNFYLLEANTVPGMTDHSLVPMAAKAAGYSFEDLVEQVLLTAFTTEPEAHKREGFGDELR